MALVDCQASTSEKLEERLVDMLWLQSGLNPNPKGALARKLSKGYGYKIALGRLLIIVFQESP